LKGFFHVFLSTVFGDPFTLCIILIPHGHCPSSVLYSTAGLVLVKLVDIFHTFLDSLSAAFIGFHSCRF
jgi:hypothetical protein